MPESVVVPEPNPLANATAAMQLDDVLKRNHDEIALKVREYARRDPGLFARMLPNAMERLLRNHELAAVGTELEFRHKALELYVDSQMAAMNEKYEALLKVLKVELRGQFIAFVMSRQQELRREMEKRRQDYIRDDEARWKFYDQYKHLPSGVAYGQTMRDECVKYFDWMTKLLTDFQNIVDEKIRSYRD